MEATETYIFCSVCFSYRMLEHMCLWVGALSNSEGDPWYLWYAQVWGLK